jgi:rRNA maturation endonuclease Nob1
MTSDTEFVTLLRCACGDKEVTESWVPADMCGRCGMPLRRVEVERREGFG